MCHTQTRTVRITDACMSLCVCVRPCLCYAPFPVSCADSLKPKGLYWYWPSSHGSQRTLYTNPASSVLTVVLLWNVKIATLNLQNTLRQFHIHAVIMMWSLIVSTWMFFVLRQTPLPPHYITQWWNAHTESTNTRWFKGGLDSRL